MPIDFQDLSLPNESSAATAGDLPPGVASPTVILAVAPGQRIELEADAALIQVSRIDDDLVLSFPTGEQLILENFAAAVADGAPPVLILPDGSEISGDAIVSEFGPGESGEALATAAGAAPTGGGGSQYQDNLGDAIGLLNAQGVIPPTVLAFGVPDPDLDGGFLGDDDGEGLGAGPVVIDDVGPDDDDTGDQDDGFPPLARGPQGDAGAGNGGDNGAGEDDDDDPGNSEDNNNSPDAPPGQSDDEGTVFTISDLDEAGGTIQGFDADTDIIDVSALLSDVDAEDRGDRIDISFEQGKDATVNLDSDGDGSFETLLVTLDNYKGDLGLDDIQVNSDLA